MVAPLNAATVLDTTVLYAQVDKRREQGHVVEVRRRIIFGAREIITEVLGGQQINTAYVERDNLTSRQSIGRLVRKILSHSKTAISLRRYLPLRIPSSILSPASTAGGHHHATTHTEAKWQPRTPAIRSVRDHRPYPDSLGKFTFRSRSPHNVKIRR